MGPVPPLRPLRARRPEPRFVAPPPRDSAASPFAPGMHEGEIARLALAHDPNIRQASWQNSHGGDGTQQAYALGFWRGAVGCALALRTDSSVTAAQALERLAQHRHCLAVSADAFDASRFGLPLPDGQALETPMGEKYAKFPEVAALRDTMRNCYMARISDKAYTMPAHMKENPDGKLFTWTVEAPTHDGGRKDLLEIEVTPIRDEEGLPSLRASWTHAAPSEANRREIEALFSGAKAPIDVHLPREDRLQQVCERVGRLHWWLSHQCNYYRGSAGISDMLSAALLLHHGFEHPGWKANTSADITALCNFDQSAFAKQYRTLMRSDPPDARVLELGQEPRSSEQ